MTREEKKEAAAPEQQQQPPNEQHDESKNTVPANDGQDGTVEKSANERKNEDAMQR